MPYTTTLQRCYDMIKWQRDALLHLLVQRFAYEGPASQVCYNLVSISDPSIQNHATFKKKPIRIVPLNPRP